MKLFAKLAESQLPEIKVAKSDAQKFFASGVKNSKAFDNSIKAARVAAINAGFDFISAKAGFQQGDWQNYCRMFAQEISERSIRRYMELADVTWRWVLYKNPGVTDMAEVRKLAHELVLVSPKPIVELCRELGHMLQFGGYYIEDHEQKKKQKLLGGAGGQIEFSFDELSASVDVFAKLGSENIFLKFPEGKDEEEALGELETKLEAALTRVREIKKHGRIIEA